MMRQTLVALVWLLASFCASAAVEVEDKCPLLKKGTRWSQSCFETKGEVRQVKAEYRNRIVPNKFGFETIGLSESLELVAVNREGVVVVPGIVHAGDFDYPTAEHGVGRFRSGNKCGYFQSDTFKILGPPIYDACCPFHQGQAFVCSDCVSYCVGPDCMNEQLVGGKGYKLNAKGKVIREFVPRTLENACGDIGVAEIGKMENGNPMLVCNSFPVPQLRR
ncbi:MULTISPECIES: hypothetical protein [unclassified Duganella]|uniref:hypothetical protein n=1 Tax=unclassified Duganella TaxID=2636909 RepID=UPI00070F6530|nr:MULTISPECIES: hypothetical protein [unclassified Duganella]KRC03749.1 hypothetical protein ASE26_02665 [Duganella sp. Root198D2]